MLVICMVVFCHLMACIGLMWIAPGTKVNPNLSDRMQWDSAHGSAWTAIWLFWVTSSISLLALFVIWSNRLVLVGVQIRWVLVGCAITAFGLPCDLTCKVTLTSVNTGQEMTSDEFTSTTTAYRWLGPALANSLYCSEV